MHTKHRASDLVRGPWSIYLVNINYEYLSAWATITIMLKTEGRKQQKFTSRNSGGWKSEIGGQHCQVLGEEPLLDLQMAAFSLCAHTVRGVGLGNLMIYISMGSWVF